VEFPGHTFANRIPAALLALLALLEVGNLLCPCASFQCTLFSCFFVIYIYIFFFFFFFLSLFLTNVDSTDEIPAYRPTLYP